MLLQGPRLNLWVHAGPPVQYERISLSRLPESNDWGYLKGFDKKYKVLKKLGQGGNGVVNVVEDQASGLQYACKKLCKVLNEPKASDVKKATHCEYLRREVRGPPGKGFIVCKCMSTAAHSRM